MTYDEANRIVRTSSYEERGKALMAMELITEYAYLYDYNKVGKVLDRIQHDKKEAIRLATIIKANKEAN